ncbi:hypothetical protein NAEGRDRAFT_81235 [Naegleria gruberi]|uniref:Uncharacterized protein n=1 Tax=Naegleria gruberi TaxID=5762 RepID=D2VU63_NAEGR|nr:uncharacterized protein NAEGRDRAFT_81235 [Naegleria gruberi]EFC39631.1 hypothetical protein NAEGRDRAFT_81235 [Naegleria gruberi]|eukprot:XP_002672375.1 hypothetical protein NAEGRDRAFT_81235 [Naegleria gruberi strain NEG-M]
MSNTPPNNTTSSSKMSNFKLFSFLVKKRKKTPTNNSTSTDQQTDSPRSSNSDTDMMIDTSPRTMTSSLKHTPEYVDVNSKTSLGALSQTSHVNPRNSARIIRRSDNEGFKNKVNNRKSAAFTKQQIVF